MALQAAAPYRAAPEVHQGILHPQDADCNEFPVKADHAVCREALRSFFGCDAVTTGYDNPAPPKQGFHMSDRPRAFAISLDGMSPETWARLTAQAAHGEPETSKWP